MKDGMDARSAMLGSGLARWHGLAMTRTVIWSLVVLGVGFLAMVLVGVSLLKIWRVTPDGFVPVLRVSWLDMVQAKMLEKSAREHMKAGRWKEASLSWRSAVANNPVDIRLLRAWLEAASADVRILEEGHVAVKHAAWLLHLGSTNVVDIDLVVRLMGRLDLEESMMQLGGPKVFELGPVAAGLVLKGWFEAENAKAFDELWTKRALEFQKDPELVLYREAWKALWGPPATAREGRESLVKAQSDRNLRKQALRLSGKVAISRGDVVEHARLLRLLGEDRMAGIRDYVEHWKLLASVGRINEAKALASDDGLSPRTSTEITMLAEVMLALGMTEKALDLLEKRTLDSKPDAKRLLLYARCLEALSRWQDLGRFARSMRGDPMMSLRLEGSSHAIEAMAFKRLGLMDNARASASKAAQAKAWDPALTFPLAAALVEAGFPLEGLSMLKPMEGVLGDKLVYWGIRVLAGSLGGDGTEMLYASGKAMAIAPDNLKVSHNRASALIMTRSEPAEAVRLTFRNLSQMPNNVDFQISHAMALLMSDRVDEAVRVLEGMSEASLNPVHAANYHLAWADVFIRRGDGKAALERYRRIESSRLMPLQEARMKKGFETLKIRMGG